MSQIALRATIDQIEANRNRCLELYGQAFDIVREAAAAASIAVPSGVYELPVLGTRNDHWTKDRDGLLELTRRSLDRSIWQHLLRATQLDRLMDKTAKDQFRAQLEDNPPPATADNCQATIERLMQDSGTIFRRGIATVFSTLDRRFRSHDGFKVGGRIVISYFADGNGYVSHGGRRDTLLDVERTFYVLDGKQQPDSDGGILGKLATAKGKFWEASAYEAESDYFRAKVFKNGNAHVWFKRDDLVDKVNLLLAEYYGAALGAGADAADVKHEPNRTPAKNQGFFETPEAVALRLMEWAGVPDCGDRKPWYEPKSILEPSAGKGALARLMLKSGHHVTCVEIDRGRAESLRGLPGLKRVIAADFFDLDPATTGLFETIVMNPPFDGQRDIDHVTHALKFLKPGGRLCSVMSAGVEFRENAKAVNFRADVARRKGEFRDLPPGSFAESGTMVNTCVLVIHAQADRRAP